MVVHVRCIVITREAVIRECIRLNALAMQDAIRRQHWGSVRVTAGWSEELDWELRDILNAQRTGKPQLPPMKRDPIPEPEGVFIDGVWVSAKLAMGNANNSTVSSEDWCFWCDRPRADCACHLDPAGIPAGHWSKAVTK